MTWMREFIQLAGRVVLPYSSGILTAVLPCLSYDDRKKSILYNHKPGWIIYITQQWVKVKKSHKYRQDHKSGTFFLNYFELLCTEFTLNQLYKGTKEAASACNNCLMKLVTPEDDEDEEIQSVTSPVSTDTISKNETDLNGESELNICGIHVCEDARMADGITQTSAWISAWMMDFFFGRVSHKCHHLVPAQTVQQNVLIIILYHVLVYNLQ